MPTGVVVILDQLTKFWVTQNFSIWESRDILGSVLRFSFVKNLGLAFGIRVGDFVYLVTLLSFAATCFIAIFLWKERNNHYFVTTSLALILGGAIGNLIDRSMIFFTNDYAGVVDFIDVGLGSFRWYTFNIADAAVTIGIILYLLHSLIIVKLKPVEQID